MRLEYDLCCKLNLSPRSLSACDRSECRGCNSIRWYSIVSVIEKVEEFCSKLELSPFHDRKVFECVEVHVLAGRPHQVVSPFVAEGVLCRNRKSSLVEPVLRGLLESGRRVRIGARSLSPFRRAAGIRHVRSRKRVEGQP